ESASCRLATPITLKFEQLQSREGYDPQKESANFGPLWKAGEWHLRDITNTMTTVAFLLLKHAAQNRQHWLERFYEIEKEAVRPPKNGELAGFLIPPAANQSRVLAILDRSDVTWEPIPPLNVNGTAYPSGTAFVRIDQPYGGFARAMLEDRIYPDLRNSKGEPIAPYDVTAHSLSRLMNVRADAVTSPFAFKSGPSIRGGGGPSGARIVAKLAVYKSQVPTMDEGWTRWVLEHHSPFTYSSLTDWELREAKLFSKYKVILIPDQARNAILNGHRKGAMPDEYTGGLGEAGVKALREFVEQGGTLVCLNRASDFAIEQFNLPLKDVVDGLPRTDFYVPGSILRVELDTNDPIAKGMPKESIAWVENSPVFEIKSDPLALARVKILASYPKNKNPLLSGWLLGGERIRGKAALVEVGMGKGRI